MIKFNNEPLYLWIIRAVIAVAIIVIVSIACATAFGAIADNNKLYEDLVGNNIGRLYEQNGGDGVVSNYIEAESMVFEGEQNGNGVITDGADSSAYGNIVDAGFNGGIALRGISTPTGNETLNTLSSTFTSDKNVRVKMVVRVQATATASAFADVFTLKVNDKTPSDLEDAVIPASSTIVSLVAGSYAMTEIEAVVDLNEGENTIVIEMLSVSDESIIDSVDFQTTATFTDASNGYTVKESATVLATPTLTETGSIKLSDGYYTAEYELPAYFSGVTNNTYSKVLSGSNYVLSIANIELGSVNASAHTVTLDGEYVEFAGGGQTTSLVIFDTLPAITYSTPDTYTLYGFYDSLNDNEIYSSDSEFVMPSSDVKLIPVYDDGVYGSAITTELQKVPLYPSSVSIHSPIRTDLGTGFASQTDLRDQTHKGAMIDGDGNGDVGIVYSYEDGVDTDYSFITMNAFDTATNTTVTNKTIYYTYQNQGSETLNFTMYQTNSSGSPETTYTHTIELAPGETKEVELTFAFSNANILSAYYFNTKTTSPLALACTEYIIGTSNGTVVEPDDGDDDEPGVAGEYTLTMASLDADGNGATFTSGESSVTLDSGSDMPAYTLAGDYALTPDVYADGTFNGAGSYVGEYSSSGYVLRGWIVTGEEKEEYMSVADFEMPTYDATITPYVVSQYAWDDANSTACESVAGNLDLSDKSTYYINGLASKQTANVIQLNTMSSVSHSGSYIVNDGMAGAEYSFSGVADNYFRVSTVFGVKNTNNTTITYTMVNTGDTAVDFTFYQTSGGTTTTGVPSQVVDLAVGESITFDVTVSYNNQNLMGFYVMNDTVSNGKIWVSATVSTELK